MVLAGDPKQLGRWCPPLRVGAARLALAPPCARTGGGEETSLRQRRFASPPDELVRNYRSHEDIFGLSSRLYENAPSPPRRPRKRFAPGKSLVGDVRSENGTSEKDARPRRRRRKRKGRPARVLFVGVRGVQTREARARRPVLQRDGGADAGGSPVSYRRRSGRKRKRKRKGRERALAGGGRSPRRTRTPRRMARSGFEPATWRDRSVPRTGCAPAHAARARGRAPSWPAGGDYQGQEEKVMFINTVAGAPPALRRRL